MKNIRRGVLAAIVAYTAWATLGLFGYLNIPGIGWTQVGGGVPFPLTSIARAYFRTSHEISAGITPTFYGWPEGYAVRYGADPTGGTDSGAALQDAFNVEGQAGGVVVIQPGSYTTVNTVNLNNSQVTVNAYGATWTYTGTGNVFAAPTTGCMLYFSWNGGVISATSSTGSIVQLKSWYHGAINNLTILGNTTSAVGLDIGVNTSGTTCPGGNYNTAWDNINNVGVFGAVGYGLRFTGNATVPTVNTLITVNGFAASVVYHIGVDFESWTDNVNFTGQTYVQNVDVTNSSAVGVVWNNSAPTSNVGVYADNFQQLAVDCFGTPTGDTRAGAVMNDTKENLVSYFYQSPACVNGSLVTTANTLDYSVYGTFGGSNVQSYAAGSQQNAIQCTTVCSVSNMVPGQIAIIRKTSPTARNTTTTLTIDGDLQYTNLPAGTYLIELAEMYVNATTTTQGWKEALGVSSASPTGNNAEGYIVATTSNTFSPLNGATNCVSTSPSSADVTSASAPTSSLGTNGIHENCFFTTSAVGSLGVYWAQASSSANNTSLLGGSWARLTRLN